MAKLLDKRLEGVYIDAYGIDVIARVGTRPNLLTARERFPLLDSRGVPYSYTNSADLVRCRIQMLANLRDQARRDGSVAGTVKAAIADWRAAFPLNRDASGAEIKDDARGGLHNLVKTWDDSAIKGIPVDALKRSDVRDQLLAWQQAGYAGSTLNHRKRALAHVLRWKLGHDDDATVVIATDGIERFKGKPTEARGIPMPILTRILATMPDRGRGIKGVTRATYSETKIRLRVMAWTGLAQMSLERLDRRRVKFKDATLFLPPREKGEGAEGLWMPLLPPALEALREFDDAELWGRSFSRSSMLQSWRRAVKNCRKALAAAAAAGDADAELMLEQFDATVAPNSYPYDTRHSFLSDYYEQTGDIRATQAVAQHADAKTTERYTKRAVPVRVAAGVEKMRAKWFPEAKKPATVREFHVIHK